MGAGVMPPSYSQWFWMPQDAQISKYLQGWLRAVGIKIDVPALSMSKLNDNLSVGDWDLLMDGWHTGPDPTYQLSIQTCAALPKDDGAGGYTDSFHCNPEYDKLFGEQQTTFDAKKRQAIVASSSNTSWYVGGGVVVVPLIIGGVVVARRRSTADDLTCLDAERYAPSAVGVAVKTCIDRYSAICLPPSVAAARITEGARRALDEHPQHGGLAPQAYTYEASFDAAHLPSLATSIPGIERAGDRTVRFTLPTMHEAIRCFRVLTRVASSETEPTYG